MRLFSTSGWRMALRSAALGTAALAAPATLSAQGDDLQMLQQVTPGAWELRFRGEPVPERICVRSGMQLLQVRFRGAGCQRRAVVDKAGEVTVQQTCRGSDNSFTRIRKESDRLLQLDSQGISAGSPFSFSAEARHQGAC